MKSSSYRGFYKLPLEERLRIISEFAELSDEESNILRNPDALPEEIADHMVENVIGRFTLPMGVGINFKINGKEYMIPMVTEEPSVIAAASNAAKMARDGGGFHASYTGSIMISQIQITDLTNPNYAAITIQEHKEEIIQMCNDKDPVLVKYGGGVVDVETRVLDTAVGKMLIVHLKVNTLDAMGANAVNTMAESVAPYLEEITGGRVYLRILSNLAVHRLARARVQVQKETLGEGVVDAILRAYAFAEVDPFRAATHNKGIMNGVVPVVLATGNDTRAIESGAHAYASITGTYKPLTVWEKDHDGNLVGTIELPMSLGLVGGATKIHPQAQVAVKMLGVKTSSELAMIIASVGLAQNLAALKVLATEGVQRGHMSLHARNLATTVGAKDDLLEQIVSIMIKEKNVRLEYAEELFNKLSTK